MDFRSDLYHAIVSEFARQGISYPEHAGVADLATRYLEMRVRRIEPVPRQVHFSDEIHDTLGGLVRNVDPKCREKASEAWGTVFYLNYLFEHGKTVLLHLSRGVTNTDPRIRDGLLWDYGMHHLHLSRKVEADGFVKRTHWLLFTIVGPEDVYFVDVRLHKDPERLQWVRQDLLDIVHRNWPELTESRLLRGVTGDEFTDAQKWELRRKNVNVVHDVGGLSVAPLGWGMMGDGHSALCRFLANKLLYDLEYHERLVDASRDEVRKRLVERGMADDVEMGFKLVCRAELKVTDDLCVEMCSREGFSGQLWRIDFAVIETNTSAVIDCVWPNDSA